MNLRRDAIQQVVLSSVSSAALEKMEPKSTSQAITQVDDSISALDLKIEPRGHNIAQREHDAEMTSTALPNQEKAKLLPVDYIPSPNSVLTGRGKFCGEAVGSKRLRDIASTFLDKYSEAETKHEKSVIVAQIMDMVETQCPSGGAFVKLEKGRWWEVDKCVAREKVGYVLRNLLHDKYRSSTKSKAKIRRLRLSQLHREQEQTLGHQASLGLTRLESDSPGLPVQFNATNVSMVLKSHDWKSEEVSISSVGRTQAALNLSPERDLVTISETINAKPLEEPSLTSSDLLSKSMMISDLPAASAASWVPPPLENLSRSTSWPLVSHPSATTKPQPQTSGSLAPRSQVIATAIWAPPPLENLSRSQSWPPVMMPSDSATNQFLDELRAPSSFTSPHVDNLSADLNSGAQEPSTTLVALAQPNMIHLMDESLEIVNGDTAPIDEKDLSSIFD